MNPTRTRATRTAAYTMIELITAIAILFVLAAILIPVLQKERQEGWATTCLSNERQIGVAVLQYAHDNDENLPNKYTWINRVIPGIDNKKQPLHCPLVANVVSKTPLGYPGYTYNTALAGMPAGSVIVDPDPKHGVPTTRLLWSFTSLNKIRFPSTTVAVSESVPGVNFAASAVPQAESGDGKPIDTQAASTRHLGGVNYLFIDGHAKRYAPAQIAAAVDENDGTRPCFHL